MCYFDKLIRRLSDGRIYPSWQLAKYLNVKKSKIYKLVKEIKELDVDLESVRGKGYRIPDGLDLLSLKKIKTYVKKNNFKHISKIEIFTKIDSTNDYLMRTIFDVNKIGICVAESQQKGKGRWGRSWFSPFGKNIYLSLSFPFFKELNKQLNLSLVVGVIIANVLTQLGVKEHISLKWPNDVLWDNRKIAGILIEAAGEAGGFSRVIVGVGLNICMKKTGNKIKQSWVDLQTIKKNVEDRNYVLGLLIDKLVEGLFRFEKQGFLPFVKSWQKFDALVNKLVKIKTSTMELQGIACGIDERGYFVLKDNLGELHTFVAGEILNCRICE